MLDKLPAFTIARLPSIHFGEGKIAELPALIAGYGKKALLVTGARAFRASPHWPTLLASLEQAGVAYETLAVKEEPSPALVDNAVQTWRGQGIDVVVGIGGGSVLDAAKAIAGLLLCGNSVLDHLEGVGRGIPYSGPALPFIAVPTTAGTGSEATKNAVLSEHGTHGYKKSFRHDTLIAQAAIVDPDLLATCPPERIAANGMDAFTQLLESYVSLKANPLTDALAVSGIQAFMKGFFPAWEQPASPPARAGRAHLAYASLLSGITLAQTGLGSVHGLAAPLGAFFPCPHGVACGTLVAEATDVNIQALWERQPDAVALHKYAHVAALITRQTFISREQAGETLVEHLRQWTTRLSLPKLRHFGVTLEDLDPLVTNSRGSSMQTNPVSLTDEEVREILVRRL